MKPNGCNGCAKWGNTLNSCYFSKYPHKYISPCPCVDCLVKTMCENSENNECQEFVKSCIYHWDTTKSIHFPNMKAPRSA